MINIYILIIIIPVDTHIVITDIIELKSLKNWFINKKRITYLLLNFQILNIIGIFFMNFQL